MKLEHTFKEEDKKFLLELLSQLKNIKISVHLSWGQKNED